MPAAARLQPRGPRATDRATITLDRAVPSRPSRNALSEASTLRQRMCKCSQLCIGRERLARRSWHDVCVEGELLVLSCSSLLEMCFFMHLKKTFTQRHTRIMRTLFLFGQLAMDLGAERKRSTLVPCSVTRAQTDVTDALGRSRESPRGRSARCGALVTAHADVISWRARGHCLNRMEGKLGERESFWGKDRGLIPCSTMPCTAVDRAIQYLYRIRL